MSKLLFDESPLVVQPTLATAIGLNEAIVLQQIHYWMQNPKSGRFIDGKHWIFNSLSDWKEQFPWWSESTIYRTLEALEDAQLLETGNFNARKGDRTKWYTLNYATYALLEALIEYAPAEETEGGRNSLFQNGTATCQNGTTLPETSTQSSPSEREETPKEPELDPLFANALQTLSGALLPYGGIQGTQVQKFNGLWGDFPDAELHKRALSLMLKKADRPNYNYYEALVRTGAQEYVPKARGLPARPRDSSPYHTRTD